MNQLLSLIQSMAAMGPMPTGQAQIGYQGQGRGFRPNASSPQSASAPDDPWVRQQIAESQRLARQQQQLDQGWADDQRTMQGAADYRNGIRRHRQRVFEASLNDPVTRRAYDQSQADPWVRRQTAENKRWHDEQQQPGPLLSALHRQGFNAAGPFGGRSLLRG